MIDNYVITEFLDCIKVCNNSLIQLELSIWYFTTGKNLYSDEAVAIKMVRSLETMFSKILYEIYL